MTIRLERICRYPVKGLQAEDLEALHVEPGAGVPHDRRFALARGDTKIDPEAPRWQPKKHFIVLMRDTELTRVACRLHAESGEIELHAPERPACRAKFDTATGRAELSAWVNDVLGARREGPAHWTEAGSVSLTDVPQNCLSIINLASVRDLETKIGVPVDPMRFRANLYVSGAEPWSEFDWVGREISIGGAALSVATRIPRCAATGVDPETGERDLNVLKALNTNYGHVDMGVYAEVRTTGELKIGDPVSPPGDARARSALGHRLHFFRFLARAVPHALRRR